GPEWLGLLTDKCIVAAHLFGPRHQYCLLAVRRLSGADVWESGRGHRARLRSLGFRLQLSLARYAFLRGQHSDQEGVDGDEAWRAATSAATAVPTGYGLPPPLQTAPVQAMEPVTTGILKEKTAYVPQLLYPSGEQGVVRCVLMSEQSMINQIKENRKRERKVDKSLEHLHLKHHQQEKA
ncbi:unnamed protein product, partial [Discosporangium mesarthrocarpum]